MTTVKNEVFIGLKHENCYLLEGDKPLVGQRESAGEGNFPTHSHQPSRENPGYTPMCAMDLNLLWCFYLLIQ